MNNHGSPKRQIMFDLDTKVLEQIYWEKITGMHIGIFQI